MDQKTRSHIAKSLRAAAKKLSATEEPALSQAITHAMNHTDEGLDIAAKGGAKDTLSYLKKGKVQLLRALGAAQSEQSALSAASDLGLQAPQVNNNGTSKKDLMEQLIAVNHAGREMEKALSDAAPHGRDYQTLKPGAFQMARKQWEDRAERIHSVMKEIEELAMAIQDQGKD